MLVVHVFETLVIAHILSGLVGLIALWIPIATKKGGRLHRKAGAVFVKSMLVTGTVAIGIATSTLIAPVETHPHLLYHPLFVGGAETIRAIFGWMMLYLAFLDQSGALWRPVRQGQGYAWAGALGFDLTSCAVRAVGELSGPRRACRYAVDDRYFDGRAGDGRDQPLVPV